jgi:glycerophosphoryl diester phosphodiesterase
MQRFPENTLPAFEAAISAGACHIEFDVQLSQDGIPVVFHDLCLDRLCSRKGEIKDYDSRELMTTQAVGAPHRREIFPNATIPTLKQLIELLNQSPQIHAFVELKRHSIEPFGLENYVEIVIETLSDAKFKYSLISFRDDALRYAQQHHKIPIGWVLREHNDAARAVAKTFSPNYLISNTIRIPPQQESFWPGPWKWAVYDIDNEKEALMWLQRGANLIETCCIVDLLKKHG